MTTKPPQPAPPIEQRPEPPPPPPPFHRRENESYDDYCARNGLANMMNPPRGAANWLQGIDDHVLVTLQSIERRLDWLESTISALLDNGDQR